jgi:catechol 2,3-dioxygenase-like lactoylglutathione lyase family enzyme
MMKTKAIFFCLVILFLSDACNGQKKTAKIFVPPLVTGVSHAAFFSRDVELDLQFYGGYLGFPSVDKDDAESNSKVIINDQQYVELIPERTKGGNRLSHFAVATSDAKAMRKYLVTKNAAVTTAISKDKHGNSFFFITDPNGIVCEFIQYNRKVVPTNKTTLADSSIARRMSHVGFMVADVDKAIAFYCDILGFTETWRGSKDGKNVNWVNLQVPDGRDYIELMLYDKEQSEENMGVINHICLEVNDVTVSAEALAKRPLPKACKQTTAIKTGINRKRQINCYDIDGTRVEIMEAQTIDGKPAPSSTAAPLKLIAH